MSTPQTNRSVLASAFFFAALLFLFVGLYDILSSFLKPIAWSILLAVVFQPLHAQALRLTRGGRGAASALVTLAIVLVVALPVTALSGVLAHEASSLFDAISRFGNREAIASLVARFDQTRLGMFVEAYLPQVRHARVDIGEVAQAALAGAGNTVVAYLGGIAKNAASLLVNLFVVLFTVFFLFRDGDRMYETLRALIPMEPAAKDAVLQRMRDMLEAVVRGMVITAALQGLATGIGLAISGVPYAAFLAVFAGVLSLLPFGVTLVWGGSAIYLFAIGSVGWSIFLVVWGALLVGTIDNFVRPIVIGGRARLSTLLLFFGMIGGLEAYGFLGLFLGPALLATLAAFIEIYRDRYALVHDDDVPAAAAAVRRQP